MIKVKSFTVAAISFFILMMPVLTGCKNHPVPGSDATISAEPYNQQAKAISNITPPDFTKLLGAYTGNFGDNKITILITTLTPDSILGRSVVAGNNRPFAGTTVVENDLYVFKAIEPGTDKHDGSFSFAINTKDPDILSGRWVPQDTIKLKPKSYTLMKKVFKYNPKVGEFAIASVRNLKVADVENLGGWELTLMRNEIFARHGYCFSRREMRDNFEKEEWYIPYSTNITADLTSIEKNNIALIKKYEKYNKDYGDDFGR